jgi:hypothetical protein
VQLFVGMKRIRLFKLFASWKAFKLWRLAVLGLKQASACRTLTKKLLLLEPVFQQPLQQVHAACHELQQLRLHCLKRGQVSAASLCSLGRYPGHRFPQTVVALVGQ